MSATEKERSMSMKRVYLPVLLICTLIPAAAVDAARLNVVTTLPDYAALAKAIGGERVSVSYIVRGDQDAHFIRPKPSFANMVREADVLIDTGLDLEMWLPTVIDTSRNRNVRSGAAGYVAASKGMTLLEKPKQISRSEGGVHIYGNPHVNTSPVLMKIAAKNIAYGLIKNDPAGKDMYLRNLKKLQDEIDRRMFGDKLVAIVGGDKLCSLAEQGRLIPYLKSTKYQGKPLISYLGGWSGRMLPLYGTPIVTYHKDWVYFCRLFGLEEAGTVEPKPGIPPSAKHVADLIKMMQQRKVSILVSANYFPEKEVRNVCSKTGAQPVIVPLYVGGASGVDDYFELIDYWVNGMLGAGRKAGVVKG
jgi:ABC-type Zn uptake system ZnuABC Zn-binding protein ZnuA